MKAVTRIVFFDDDNQKFFGEGPCRLLHAVEETGSLRAAAISMEMAYTKALKIINNAEKALGFSLIVRSVGGKSGGGSVITKEGKAWLEKYEAYRDACFKENKRLYEEFFEKKSIEESTGYNEIGCVIMASGLGKRFGGNKLMAQLEGKPVIQWVLDATEGLFLHRVVVTRNKEVEALCKNQGIDVIYHEFPGRNDTVRLGLEKLAPHVKNCMFCLADQPLLSRETLSSLAMSVEKDKESIWRLTYNDNIGCPVVFPEWTFKELFTLPEGKGGNVVIHNHYESVKNFQAQNMFELKDIDTKEDLEEVKLDISSISMYSQEKRTGGN